MASRSDHRRRERSWEREDRDRDRGGRYGGRPGGSHKEDERRRSSRSRSPGRRDRRPERSERGRGGYRRDREEDRRDRDRDSGRRREDGRDRDYDDRRPSARRGDERDYERDREYSRRHEGDRGDGDRGAPSKPEQNPSSASSNITPGSLAAAPARANDGTPDINEEDGEAMDAVNDEDTAMMSMMGIAGFGTTKGKHVLGNQEGTANVKKMRTWRQYMNRRGGFNRPLDKIK